MISMKFIFVKKESAESSRKHLIESKILAEGIKAIREEERIGFPVSAEKEEAARELFNKNNILFTEEDIEAESKKSPRSIEELLSAKLGDKTLFLKKSFDVIGDIAIIEGSEELKRYEKDIAEAIMKINGHIKSVYIKSDVHQGEYRIQPIKYVLGEERTETVHHENGYRIFLDVEKTYFSPRLSGERRRIAEMISLGEDILVLFSGVGPYGLAAAKLSDAKSIVCVELNENAHEHALINIEKNHIKNMSCVCADAREECKKLALSGRKFNRIIMPLPRLAHTFLKDAITVAKEGAIIHLYQFSPEEEIEVNIHSIVKEAIGGLCEYEIKHIEKAGQYAPGKYRVCADIIINNIG